MNFKALPTNIESSLNDLARRLLPLSAYRLVRGICRGAEAAILIWPSVILMVLRIWISNKRLPNRVFSYAWSSPGDDLLCTAIFHDLEKTDLQQIAMISNYPDLFTDAGDNLHVVRATSRWSVSSLQWKRELCFAQLCGAELVRPRTAVEFEKDRQTPPSRHHIATVCANAGISGRISLRPYFRLDEMEISGGAWANDRIAIQNSGPASNSRNKKWFPERFQAVIDALNDDVQFVQVGTADDPPLRNVQDLRGRTSIGETAAILHNARLYLGAEGFLMHLARAVECPSVIIYGGRLAPWQTGYICNLNLYTPLPCAPCWRINECDFDRRCMQEIGVGQVVAAVRKMLSRPRGPLAVETMEL